MSTVCRKTRWTDRHICIALFVCLSSLYFATVSGITSSNDGSHYALTRALAEQRSFEIEDFAWYAEGNDIAVRDDRIYSDRPPGTALIASAFYAAGRLLPSPLAPLESRHDPENPRLLYVTLVPVWSGACTVVLLYLTLRKLEVSVFGALTTSLVFALGTTHWKYSSVLLSHAASSFLVVLSVYLVVKATRSPSIHWLTALGLGFISGYSVLVEYSNAILVVASGLYLLAHVRSLRPTRLLLHAGLFVAGGVIPAGFLAYYNTVNFGGPFTLSYAYAVNYPWAGRFSSTFSFPLGQGLLAMLVWGKGGGWCNPTCYNQGLFLLSPVLLFSLPGLVSFFRRSRRECIFTTGLFLIYLVTFSKHHTFHGFTSDGRYLVPFLGLWCIPIGFFLDQLLRRITGSVSQTLAHLAFYGLLFLSLRSIFMHIGFSYNYHLDLAQLTPVIASPTNWSYLSSQVFRNTGNLPILWLLECGALAIWLAGRHLISRRSNGRATEEK
jgi:hypothetical protein